MSFSHDVEVAIAQLIVAGSAGVYNAPGSPYGASDLGVTHKRLSDLPSRQISLLHYSVQANPGQAVYQGAVQVRTRGNEDPGDVDSIADAIYALLHGQDQVTSNGVYFGHIWWASGTSLGADNEGRWQRSDNYYFWSARPTTALTD